MIRDHPCDAIVESDWLAGEHVVKARYPPALPAAEWAVQIGDCVHNVRAALDHLAWELAGSVVADHSTMFPIVSRRADWQKQFGRLSRIPKWARTAMEAMQPYHLSEPEITALWVLRTLDDADKHRRLTVTIAVPASLHLTFIPPDVSLRRAITMAPFVALEHNAAIATLTLSGPPTLGTTIRATFQTEVTFGPAAGLGPAVAVLPAIRVVLKDVAEIIDKFDDLIQHQ